MILRTALLALGLVVATTPATTQSIRATSAYTALDLDRCTRIDREPEPASARWRCKGHAGIPLFVQDGDDRFDVDAGREDRDELWSDSFDYPAKRSNGGFGAASPSRSSIASIRPAPKRPNRRA